MIVEFLASILGGIAAHQTRRITEQLTPGWRNITEHGVGVLCVYPFFLWFRRSLRNGKDRSDAAYGMAFLGVGIGVAFGWLIDTFWSR